MRVRTQERAQEGADTLNEWVFGAVLALAGLILWGIMFLLWEGDTREGVLGRPRVSWKELETSGHMAGGVSGPLDYHTNGWGDVIAMPLINFAVGAAVYRFGVNWNAVLVSGLLGFLASYAFYRIATKPKRAEKDIDWWFRFADKRVYVSLPGYIHLVYFAFQAGIIVLGLRYLATHRMSLPMIIVGSTGVFLYVTAFTIDKWQGHFD